MKIAVLSSHTPSLFWFRMDMMKKFMELGHEVIAIGNEEVEKWSLRFQNQGIEYRQIPVQRNGMNPLKDLKTVFAIQKVLKEVQPDKIFTYQAKTIIYGTIAANMIGITEVYPLIAGMGSVFLNNSIKTRLVRMVLVWEYRFAMRRSPAVFFQNPEDEQIFRHFRIIRKHKTIRIPGSGVNLEKFTVQSLPEKTAFLCISRLIRDKGVQEYLDACRLIRKQYPDTRCLLVGPFDSNPSAITPDQLKPYLQDGSVEYFGEQEDVRPYLAQCSVFVLPSYREGTPKTNLEAMASGRAVITTDAPGCRETVVDGKNGYLVSVKDVDSLQQKMAELIEHPENAASFGKEGRKLAETRFDVQIVNKTICETMDLFHS